MATTREHLDSALELLTKATEALYAFRLTAAEPEDEARGRWALARAADLDFAVADATDDILSLASCEESFIASRVASST